jgi:5-methylcytosine-specific restriction endonuclease McrA
LGKTRKRKVLPYHNGEWLAEQYLTNLKSVKTIATECGVTTRAVMVFMEKFGIQRRTQTEVRKVKFWSGARSMLGRTGSLNPNWHNDSTLKRRKTMQRKAWLDARQEVIQRDRVCRLCSSPDASDVHHIERLSDAPLLMYDSGNLILLCRDCHYKLRGKEERWKGRLLRLLQSVDDRHQIGTTHAN